MNLPQYEPTITDADRQAMIDYIQSGGWLTEHRITQAFEAELSKQLGVQYVSAVNNGTIAIAIALLAGGIRSGDVVLVPALTMMATATACELIGAVPNFVDIDPETLCMDVERAQEVMDAVSPRALIYVSLNGRWGPVDATHYLFKQCRDRGMIVIEDAAQSLGSELEHVGHAADMTTFSFSPHKLLQTGQGGCVVTNSAARHERIERLKDFGRLQGGTDVHETFGINAKFTDLQASLGLSQLRRFTELRRKKQAIYARYYDQLRTIPEVRFVPTSLNTVPWFVDVYTDLRDQLVAYLAHHEIGTRKVYPCLHQQPYYRLDELSFPVAEWFSRRGLWLPSGLSLTTEQIDHVCYTIHQFFNEFRRAQEESHDP